MYLKGVYCKNGISFMGIYLITKYLITYISNDYFPKKHCCRRNLGRYVSCVGIDFNAYIHNIKSRCAFIRILGICKLATK